MLITIADCKHFSFIHHHSSICLATKTLHLISLQKEPGSKSRRLKCKLDLSVARQCMRREVLTGLQVPYGCSCLT